MNRRDSVYALLALASFPDWANAQQSRKLPVVGFLHPGSPYQSPALIGLRDGLREEGHIEGETIRIEARWGLGKPESLAGIAEELVRMKVDVMVAVGSPSVRVMKKATSIIPIVAADLETDPVAGGLAKSFARPGSNVTGLFLDLPSLSGKSLQLLREVVPETKRIVALWDANTTPYHLRAFTAAAKAISMEVQVLELREAAGLENVLGLGMKSRPHALLQLGSPLINSLANRIAAFSSAHHLPAISPFRAFPDTGGLMSYGPNLSNFFRRLAPYISKIIKGAKPGDLPIEQPTHFELIVNMSTARALGIKLSQSMLLRADQVIE